MHGAGRLPRVADRFLVPATPEPHVSCNLRGMAEFRERDVGGAWITRQIRGGDLFVTRSRTPYEVRFQSPPGEELDNLSIHSKSPRVAALTQLFAAHLVEQYTESAAQKQAYSGGLPIDSSARCRITWPSISPRRSPSRVWPSWWI